MNYSLPFIPERPVKPRNSGITMVMDKGLCINEAANLIDASGSLVDFVKLGFGTSYITNKLEEKINLYKAAGIRPYFGGTLFEAFIIRGMFDEFIHLLDKYKIETVEVSDGSICLDFEMKCKYINTLAKSFLVLSEVGSKDCNVVFTPEKWVLMLNSELQAGSYKVITEARESGNVGIYNSNGNADTVLINEIIAQVPVENIIWEAPNKSQQAWFVNLLGSNVNLGNIASDEVIALETLRLGLRSDTFLSFLPESLKNQ
jgi:phosphosulfolactate synthase